MSEPYGGAGLEGVSTTLQTSSLSPTNITPSVPSSTKAHPSSESEIAQTGSGGVDLSLAGSGGGGTLLASSIVPPSRDAVGFDSSGHQFMSPSLPASGAGQGQDHEHDTQIGMPYMQPQPPYHALPHDVYLQPQASGPGSDQYPIGAPSSPTQSATAVASEEMLTKDAERETADEDAGPVKLFVGQVPKGMSEEDLFPMFAEFGPIKELTIIRDKHTGQHRGCAFVTYWSTEDAERVQEALHDQLTLPNGRKPVQIRPAIDPHNPSSQMGYVSTPEQENKLFVGMTSRNADENSIRDLFAAFGEIREIYIIRNADGSNKGCAFLKFAQRESALSAIESLNDKIVMEGATRPLIVKFADTKAQRRARQGNSHSGRGRGGGGHSNNPNPYYMHHSGPPVPVYPNYQGQQGPPGPPMAMPYYGQQHSHPYGHGPGTPPPPPNYMYPIPRHGHPYAYPPAGPFPQMGGGSHGGASPTGSAEAFEGPSTGGQNSMPHHPGRPNKSQRGQGQEGDGNMNNNPRPREGPAGANLFIYHLPHDLTDADLATAFNPFGNVISAKVYVDKYTGESKGFGFVSYDSVVSAEAAIEQMNGFQIGTKRLKVQHKRVSNAPRRQQQQYDEGGMPQQEGAPGGMMPPQLDAGMMRMMHQSSPHPQYQYPPPHPSSLPLDDTGGLSGELENLDINYKGQEE